MKRNSKNLLHQKDVCGKHTLSKLIYEEAKDIINSTNFKKTRKHYQHGNKTVHGHCFDVAGCSLYLNRKFKLKCKEKDLVRGAMLHD